MTGAEHAKTDATETPALKMLLVQGEGQAIGVQGTAAMLRWVQTLAQEELLGELVPTLKLLHWKPWSWGQWGCSQGLPSTVVQVVLSHGAGGNGGSLTGAAKVQWCRLSLSQYEGCPSCHTVHGGPLSCAVSNLQKGV